MPRRRNCVDFRARPPRGGTMDWPVSLGRRFHCRSNWPNAAQWSQPISYGVCSCGGGEMSAMMRSTMELFVAKHHPIPSLSFADAKPPTTDVEHSRANDDALISNTTMMHHLLNHCTLASILESYVCFVVIKIYLLCSSSSICCVCLRRPTRSDRQFLVAAVMPSTAPALVVRVRR